MKENPNKRFSRESSVDKYSALNGYHDGNEDSKEPYDSSMEALLIETSDNGKSKVRLPDFSHTINTNFSMVSNDINKTFEDSSKQPSAVEKSDKIDRKKMERCNSAFSFSKFEKLLAGHIENEDLMSTSLPNNSQEVENGLHRPYQPKGIGNVSPTCDTSIPPSVWAMDVSDGLLVLGCSNGRIELWESFTGKLKVRSKTCF